MPRKPHVDLFMCVEDIATRACSAQNGQEPWVDERGTARGGLPIIPGANVYPVTEAQYSIIKPGFIPGTTTPWTTWDGAKPVVTVDSRVEIEIQAPYTGAILSAYVLTLHAKKRGALDPTFNGTISFVSTDGSQASVTFVNGVGLMKVNTRSAGARYFRIKTNEAYRITPESQSISIVPAVVDEI